MNKTNRNYLKHITAILVAVSFLLTCMPTIGVNAADYLFKYKIVATKEVVKYNYTSPVYFINNEQVDITNTPAIIISNTSLACAEAVFGGIKHMNIDYDEVLGTITFSYNENTVIMTLGSKTAYVNGTPKDCGVAPFRIRYSKNKVYANLVPTRFVTENLGMTYTWTQASSSVHIETPLRLEIEGKPKSYNGTLGKIKYNDTVLNTTKTPSYIFSNTAFLCLKTLCKGVEGLEYTYATNGSIEVKYGDITLNMKINSQYAYVNGVLESIEMAPLMIYNDETGYSRVYVPGRYVMETLGFSYDWNSKTGTSEISNNEKTGVYDAPYDDIIVVDAEHGPKKISKKNTLGSLSEYNPAEETINSFLLTGINTGTIKPQKAVYFSRLERLENWSGESLKYNYKQEFYFPLMEGICTDLIEIKDYVYDNLVTFELSGYYMDYYREQDIINTGEAIEQLQIIYLEDEDITRIKIYTRTDKTGIILGHKDSFTESGIDFTFDWPANLYDKIIILDPGHGDTDPGAVSKNYKEKNLNYDIVYQYCRELFDESDIKVYYTRIDDTLTPLHVRPTLPVRLGADFYVSVHHNANSNTKINGTEVYYGKSNTGSYFGLTGKIMATRFMNQLTTELGYSDHGIKGATFVVVDVENYCASVLLEIGYMTNPDELKNITDPDNQKKAANAIYNAVRAFFDEYYPNK